MKYLTGWMIITVSYFLTLYLSLMTGFFIFPSQKDLGGGHYIIIENNITYLKFFVTVMMIVIPFVIVGMYIKKKKLTKRDALWISVVPVAAERLIILILGLILASEHLYKWDISSIVPFIHIKTPAIYFSYAYIFSGIISILIAIAFVQKHKVKQT
ncbi:hypothetical protein CIB95_02110 [Lottiidibacillus patelloidae]|uniref:Uncharacterized protein n=1 Tax=Lottiidibacillus patelloidae TaxID=2670334 RepID=A0A263BYZ0_9BACI|nr:hypothetical protein [Lottiidibacillus patelloidae]OZM58386.1 hypothetical protein CIB95_02110 [Lottiidibacillus patelloidae]